MFWSFRRIPQISQWLLVLRVCHVAAPCVCGQTFYSQRFLAVNNMVSVGTKSRKDFSVAVAALRGRYE